MTDTNDELTGNWQGRGGLVQINADRSITIGGQTYMYVAQNNVLTIAPLVDAFQISYQLTGDTLTLSINGQVNVLTREPTSDQTSSPTSVTRSESDSARARPPDPTMNAFAGVWVGEEASLDPQYYMRFTRYLMLYPDGSVGLDKTEGGASSTQISEYQQRFSYFSSGRTGNQKVQGQWATDGSNIQVQWKNNNVWQGQFDPASGKMVMFGVGVIEEGSNVTFKRQ
jgi:hypothetical protein